MEQQLEVADFPLLADVVRCGSKFHAKGNPTHHGPVVCYVIMPCTEGYRCQGWLWAVRRLWAVDCTRCHRRHHYPAEIRIEEL